MKKWLDGREEPVAPDELRAIREEAGLTLEALAEVVGVMPLEVAAWESGAITPAGVPGRLRNRRGRISRAGSRRITCAHPRCGGRRALRAPAFSSS